MSTIDQESVQMRILKSQYEREKRLVEDKVRELALISVNCKEDIENHTRKLKTQVGELKLSLKQESQMHQKTRESLHQV